jgi:D-alanyl-D-alanine carboxypeptidase/D-alanyl-D-alanine-endopeptidase (penicillin-binding protein 4)
MTRLLRHAHGQPWGRALRISLARPGESGTLRKRLTSLPTGVMVSAKTGTLNGVSALAGYIDSPGRPAVAFAILTNQLPGGASPARRAQDEIVALLASR